MRKLWLLVTIVTALSLAACTTKEDPQPQPTPTPAPSPTPTPTPTPTPPELKPVTVKLTVTDANSTVKFIELTEDGKFIVCEKNDPTKGREYFTGNYTIADGQYKLGDVGSLTFTETGSTATFSLKKNDGKVVSGSASVAKNNNPSSKVSTLCKMWTITKTQVKITEALKVNADFTGCNLEEIADFVRKQGVEIKHDFTGISVSSIWVTPSGTIFIFYSNGKIDAANCDLSSFDKDGTIKYSWMDTSAMGYDFTNGTANAAFQGENCVVTVGSDITHNGKNYKVSVILVLAEKK